MPIIRPATAVAYSQSRICAPSGALTDAQVADRHQHLVGGVRPEVRSLRVGDDHRQDALAVLAGRLGDQLLGPVAEPVDLGPVVRQHDLVDLGPVRDTQQRT
jgi:hypothetical protein